jgi:hypothetical protein
METGLKWTDFQLALGFETSFTIFWHICTMDWVNANVFLTSINVHVWVLIFAGDMDVVSLYARLQPLRLPVDTVCRIWEVMTPTSHAAWPCINLFQHSCRWVQVGGHNLAWTHIGQLLCRNSYMNFEENPQIDLRRKTYIRWHSEISQMWYSLSESFIVSVY